MVWVAPLRDALKTPFVASPVVLLLRLVLVLLLVEVLLLLHRALLLVGVRLQELLLRLWLGLEGAIEAKGLQLVLVG